MVHTPSNPAEFQRLTGLIRQRGWPLTKAAYVKALEYPFAPTFPLDAETQARVPPELPGRMPTALEDLSFSPRVVTPGASVSSAGGRRLDPSLVHATAKRHGLSYEDAEQQLKDFGG